MYDEMDGRVVGPTEKFTPTNQFLPFDLWSTKGVLK